MSLSYLQEHYPLLYQQIHTFTKLFIFGKSLWRFIEIENSHHAFKIKFISQPFRDTSGALRSLPPFPPFLPPHFLFHPSPQGLGFILFQLESWAVSPLQSFFPRSSHSSQKPYALITVITPLLQMQRHREVE